MQDANIGSNLITSPAAILKELIFSKEKGNVVGLWIASFNKTFNKVVCLTAVDEIIDVEITNDKLVLLKKLDLQGVYLNNNEIYLSEIERVITFNTTYYEHLMACLQPPEAEAGLIKIRLREQIITPDDLKMILIQNLNSGNRISFKKTDGIKACYLRDFNPYSETILIADQIRDGVLEEISVKAINEIEFEFHYNYKGFSSRVFKIKQEQNRVN